MSRNSVSRLWKYILLCTSPPFTQLPLQDAVLIVTGEVRSKTSSIAMKHTLLDDVYDLVEALSSDLVGGTEIASIHLRDTGAMVVAKLQVADTLSSDTKSLNAAISIE